MKNCLFVFFTCFSLVLAGQQSMENAFDKKLQEAFQQFRQVPAQQYEERNKKWNELEAVIIQITQKACREQQEADIKLLKSLFSNKELNSTEGFATIILCHMVNEAKACEDAVQQQKMIFLILDCIDFSKVYVFNSFLLDFLDHFYKPEYYNEKSKHLLKEKIINKSNIHGNFLIFLDAAGMYDDPAVKEYLISESEKCKQWESDVPWYALLLLSHYGHPGAVENLLKVTEQKYQNKHERWVQVFYMYRQMAFIKDPRVVAFLQSFLASDEHYSAAGPFQNSVSLNSALALQSMIVGFPGNLKEPYYIYKDKQQQECIEWLPKHPDYRFFPKKYLSDDIKRALWSNYNNLYGSFRRN